MLRLIVVFATVLALSASATIPSTNLTENNGRIVGGKVTDISKIPHQISLRWKGCPTCAFQPLCGGSIITNKIILTAAHCVIQKKARELHIVAGTNELEGYGIVIPVKKIVSHEDFDKKGFGENDIALLFLVIELPLNNYDIKTIKMTKVRPFPNEIGKTSGWGLTTENSEKSDLLREVEVPIISQEVCSSQMKLQNQVITDSMICAGLPNGTKDTCGGDSGGPLSVNGILVGVVSWGVGCARPNSAGVYASVADLRPWIDAKIKANFI